MYKINNIMIFIIFFTFSFISIIPMSFSVGEILFIIYLFFSLKIIPILLNFLNIRKHILFYFVVLSFLITLFFNKVDFAIKDIINPLYLIVYLFLFYLFLHNNMNKIDIMIKALLYSIYIHFFVGIGQLIYPDVFYFNIDLNQRSAAGNIFRVSGLFTNPNDLMLYLIMLIPFTYKFKFKFTRYILLSTLLLTLSKVAFLIIAITLLYDLLLSSMKIKLYIFTLIAFLYIVFNQEINEVFLEISKLIEYRLTNADSLESRLRPLYIAIDNIEDWFFLGSGPMGDLKYSDVRIHNFFISLWIQYGIFAILLLISNIVLIGYMYVKKRSKNNIYYITSLLLWSIGSFFNTITYYKIFYIIPILSYIQLLKNQRYPNVRHIRNK